MQGFALPGERGASLAYNQVVPRAGGFPVLSFVELELFAGRVGHHVGRPWWVPYDLDGGVFAVGDTEQLVLNFLCDHHAHLAAGRCQSHRDVDGAARDLDSIDESEVHEVDRNLGVVALAQYFVDLGFGKCGRILHLTESSI
ncbi:MAG: hypothetical protein JWM69_1368 [Candidatus Binatus sp.]|nr:hypothetical protein [Candidatus Binatus sp.]